MNDPDRNFATMTDVRFTTLLRAAGVTMPMRTAEAMRDLMLLHEHGTITVSGAKITWDASTNTITAEMD